MRAIFSKIRAQRQIRIKKPKRPENERYWTTLYFGPRGSGKSQHQAKEVKKIFEYLRWLYFKKPTLKQAIVFSVQKFSPAIEKEFLGNILYYWTEPDQLHYCPRTKCWKGSQKHRLHGAYIIFDDVAAMFPADAAKPLPIWMVKTFSQARKFGIRCMANCQDPFSVNINFRRYIDMCYKFQKIFSTSDPDETRPEVKRVFGIYRRRRIKAEILWQYGDKSEIDIIMMRAQAEQKAEKLGIPGDIFGSMWVASWHLITRKTTQIYDTLQEIKEYEPAGYLHHEKFCIDPKHDHTDKKAPNYCNFKKVTHELV